MFGIAFSTVATVLAILTYLRAKETILQPVRNEIIKKQVETLANLFQAMGDCDPIGDLDYPGIVTITTLATRSDMVLFYQIIKKLWRG